MLMQYKGQWQSNGLCNNKSETEESEDNGEDSFTGKIWEGEVERVELIYQNYVG